METKINKSQQRAIDRIMRFYENSVSYDKGNYHISSEIVPLGFETHLNMTVKVKRIDCDQYSPRAIICGDGGHFFIGPRGHIQVASSYQLIADKARRLSHLRHIALMVRGEVCPSTLDLARRMADGAPS
jgi:hypothetical protein